MSQSLSKILVHLVFSTKHRQPFIDAAIEAELHPYLATICRENECPSIQIGGTTDHIHALFVLSKNKSIKEIVQELKHSSSIWIKTKGVAYGDFYWQGGYGAFSIGESAIEQTRNYILNQKEHHRRISFQDELRALLRKYNVEFDERYIWE